MDQPKNLMENSISLKRIKMVPEDDAELTWLNYPKILHCPWNIRDLMSPTAKNLKQGETEISLLSYSD